MTLTLVLIFAAALFLAYSNGANDNFKGVATLYGSGVVSFRGALIWGTLTTLAGSLTAAFIGQEMIRLFSGQGLVPTAVMVDPAFMTAVILGAGLTVFGAAKAGIPISTTHALTGGLVGAGLAAAAEGFRFEPLLAKFLLPLAVAPLIPIVIVGVIYPALTRVARRSSDLFRSAGLIGRTPQSMLAVATSSGGGGCRQIEAGSREGVALTVGHEIFERFCDVAHFMSAGTVSFARGLNDTPKIAGVALAAGAINVHISIYAIAIAMALGGLIHARAVAETMSHKITQISHGQGIVANMVTTLTVLFASKLGVPVSTTHVSVGAIFGIGAGSRRVNSKLVAAIITAWVLTLPCAMGISAVLFIGLHSLQ